MPPFSYIDRRCCTINIHQKTMVENNHYFPCFHISKTKPSIFLKFLLFASLKHFLIFWSRLTGHEWCYKMYTFRKRAHPKCPQTKKATQQKIKCKTTFSVPFKIPQTPPYLRFQTVPQQNVWSVKCARSSHIFCVSVDIINVSYIKNWPH